MTVAIVGGGAFGTAIAACIAATGRPVLLLVRSESDAASVNQDRRNARYLPDHKLPRALKASCDPAALARMETVLLAVPAHSIEAVCVQLRPHLRAGVRVVNMAKGLHPTLLTLNRAIAAALPEAEVGALKGPTFARPLIHGAPSGLTLAFENPASTQAVAALFEGSQIHIQPSPHLEGVEFISALKNVLAVTMGICDAIEDNPNTRFLVMQKILSEAHTLVQCFGFDPAVLFTYAGFGDLLMTALNDTSRNRTLGLLIGRGFELAISDNGPVLEGRRSVHLIEDHLNKMGEHRPLIRLLAGVFEHRISPQQFFDELTHRK